MKTINMDNVNKEIYFNHTSKGDQPKWKYKNVWYKQDVFGYESLSEIIISRLLKSDKRVNIVEYSPILIEYNGKRKMGCYSNSFLNNGEELFTLERIHLITQGTSLAEKIKEISSISDKIKYTVDVVSNVTKIKDVGETLTKYLEIDKLFLNEDRHTNNIAFIRDKNHKWRFAPLFDNGLSLLSDLEDYPILEKLYFLKRKVRSKPFASSFDKQVEEAETLYGVQWQPRFTVEDVNRELSALLEYYNEDILMRVEKIIASGLMH